MISENITFIRNCTIVGIAADSQKGATYEEGEYLSTPRVKSGLASGIFVASLNIIDLIVSKGAMWTPWEHKISKEAGGLICSNPPPSPR